MILLVFRSGNVIVGVLLDVDDINRSSEPEQAIPSIRDEQSKTDMVIALSHGVPDGLHASLCCH